MGDTYQIIRRIEEPKGATSVSMHIAHIGGGGELFIQFKSRLDIPTEDVDAIGRNLNYILQGGYARDLYSKNGYTYGYVVVAGPYHKVKQVYDQLKGYLDHPQLAKKAAGPLIL